MADPASDGRARVSGETVVFDFETRSDPAEVDRRARKERREARRRRRLRRRLGYSFVGMLLLGILGAVMVLEVADEAPVQAVSAPTVAPPPEPVSPETKPPGQAPVVAEVPQQTEFGLAGNPEALKKRVEEVAEHYGGAYGVVISDPASDETVALGADETFFAASLGKLPTLLSLYKTVDRGEVNLDDNITMQASDVQGYGTGELHAYPVGHTITLRECAYYLMNKSDNTAWAMLTRYLGADGIQADLSDIGAYNTGYWIPNTTTANDVLLMLQKIADPSFTSASLSKEMLGSMTNTAFEDRIPAGLPPEVRVAHKIGTYENSFSDAGIVFYEGPDGKEHHYFIVVLTEGAGEANARAAIQEISAAAHEMFATP